LPFALQITMVLECLIRQGVDGIFWNYRCSAKISTKLVCSSAGPQKFKGGKELRMLKLCPIILQKFHDCMSIVRIHKILWICAKWDLRLPSAGWQKSNSWTHVRRCWSLQASSCKSAFLTICELFNVRICLYGFL
jgi:hypothetical protein